MTDDLKPPNPATDFLIEIVGGGILCLAVAGALFTLRQLPWLGVPLAVLCALGLGYVAFRVSLAVAPRPNRTISLMYAASVAITLFATALMYCDC